MPFFTLFEGAPTDKKSHAYWVFWHHFEIIGGEKPAEPVVPAEPTTSEFKARKDFTTDDAYGEYISTVLKGKMRVRAISDYEKVKKGMTGTYYGTTPGNPPCFVLWDEDLGRMWCGSKEHQQTKDPMRIGSIGITLKSFLKPSQQNRYNPQNSKPARILIPMMRMAHTSKPHSNPKCAS